MRKSRLSLIKRSKTVNRYLQDMEDLEFSGEIKKACMSTHIAIHMLGGYINLKKKQNSMRILRRWSVWRMIRMKA